jgi:hypothetical protein
VNGYQFSLDVTVINKRITRTPIFLLAVFCSANGCTSEVIPASSLKFDPLLSTFSPSTVSAHRIRNAIGTRWSYCSLRGVQPVIFLKPRVGHITPRVGAVHGRNREPVSMRSMHQRYALDPIHETLKQPNCATVSDSAVSGRLSADRNMRFGALK